VSKESKIDGFLVVAAGVDGIDEGNGLGGFSKESKMDDCISPDGAAGVVGGFGVSKESKMDDCIVPAAGAARVAGLGGGASKESKIEDCIPSQEGTEERSIGLGLVAGTSNESKIDVCDCTPPAAGWILGCTGMGTA
jgi:hypothetical protein